MVIKSPNLSTLEEESLSGSFCYTSDMSRYQEWIQAQDESECSSSGYARSDDSSRSRSPVSHWLYLIRDSTEVESLSALQAKSVAVNEESFEALSVRNAQVAIKKTRKESLELLNMIDHLISQLPLTTDDLPLFKRDIDHVTYGIQSLIEHCRRRGCDHIETPIKGRHSSSDVAVHGMHICKFVDDFTRRRNVNNAQLEASMRKMHARLRQVTETTIQKDAHIIVQALRFEWGSICSKWALLALWQLTQNDAYVSSVFLEDGYVVRRLMCLACIRSPTLSPNLPASALRILTHMTAEPDCIKQIFAINDTPGNLITLLSFEKNEVVLIEALGLLVQITMPLIDSKKKLKEKTPDPDNTLESLVKVIPVPLLVKSLTSLARVCHSRELFHLISASLANISFLDPESLVQNETCSNLMSAIRNKFSQSEDIYLKDQIVTILANISSTNPLDVVSSGGLVFLLSCLEMRSPAVAAAAATSCNRQQQASGSGRHASSSRSPKRRGSRQEQHDEDDDEEEASIALERMQQKVAAAVARLASNKSCAVLLLRLNAARRLADLCRNPRERNYSDTVLLASLAGRSLLL